MGPHAPGRIPPINRHSGRLAYPEGDLPRSANQSQALVRSTDNVAAAFLTFLADEQLPARTPRSYIGQLGRCDAASPLGKGGDQEGQGRQSTYSAVEHPCA